MPKNEIIFIIGSYLLGSIPFGYLIVFFSERKDIRKIGSGNIGATNVIRSKGIGAGLCTLVLDMLKGVIPILYGFRHFDSPVLVMAGGAAAVFGHMFPLFLKFKGGKGVATLAGVILFFHFPTALVAALFFLVGVSLTRYVSLGSIMGSLALFFSLLFTQIAEVALVAFWIVLVIIVKHRSNIKRIIAGNENRLTFKKNG